MPQAMGELMVGTPARAGFVSQPSKAALQLPGVGERHEPLQGYDTDHVAVTQVVFQSSSLKIVAEPPARARQREAGSYFLRLPPGLAIASMGGVSGSHFQHAFVVTSPLLSASRAVESELWHTTQPS